MDKQLEAMLTKIKQDIENSPASRHIAISKIEARYMVIFMEAVAPLITYPILDSILYKRLSELVK